jgi:hypothetical protein
MLTNGEAARSRRLAGLVAPRGKAARARLWGQTLVVGAPEALQAQGPPLPRILLVTRRSRRKRTPIGQHFPALPG